MHFKQQLIEMNACPDAVEWVGNKTPEEAWNTCDRADWMLWLCHKISVDNKSIVLAACDIAEAVMHLIPESEKRPSEAIKTARDWCNGNAILDDVRRAAHAAYAAADAGDARAASFETNAKLVRKRIPVNLITERINDEQAG